MRDQISHVRICLHHFPEKKGGRVNSITPQSWGSPRAFAERIPFSKTLYRTFKRNRGLFSPSTRRIRDRRAASCEPCQIQCLTRCRNSAAGDPPSECQLLSTVARAGQHGRRLERLVFVRRSRPWYFCQGCARSKHGAVQPSTVMIHSVLREYPFDLPLIAGLGKRQHEKDTRLLRIQCIGWNQTQGIVIIAMHDATVTHTTGADNDPRRRDGFPAHFRLTPSCVRVRRTAAIHDFRIEMRIVRATLVVSSAASTGSRPPAKLTEWWITANVGGDPLIVVRPAVRTARGIEWSSQSR